MVSATAARLVATDQRQEVHPGHRRRICIVTETFPPEVNGVANTLHHLARHLSGSHDVDVVCPSLPDSDSAIESADTRLGIRRLRVSGLPIPGYSELRFGLPCKRRLLREWKQQRPDAVYVATQGPLGRSALQACEDLGLPVVSGFHTNFHQYSQYYRLGWLSNLISRYLRRFHSRTLKTLVPTAQTAESLESMGIINTHVWSRGVDCRLFNSARRSPELRQQWGADAHTPVFIYVGRLANEKNVFLALSAYERARQQYGNVRMVLVGGGPLQERIRRRYPDIIMAGVQKGEALARHYASADIFLFPSLTDTFGNVVLEAMASGLGIVSFNEAAAREHLSHEGNGLLAASGNNDQFCQHALSLAMRPSLLNRIRIGAEKTAQSLEWSRLSERFAELLLYPDQEGSHHENAQRLRAVPSGR